MSDVTLDTLLVKIGADTKPLREALGGITKTADGSFSDIAAAASRASDGMARALSDFVSGGKLGLEDLKSTALSVLGSVAGNALRSGLGSLFGSSAASYLGKTGTHVVGSLLSGLIAGRASGGPVSAGTPYVVGEYGRELFVPKVSGAIVSAGALAGSSRPGVRPISITVNVQGAGGVQEMRQSAGQVATTIARTLARADRNL